MKDVGKEYMKFLAKFEKRQEMYRIFIVPIKRGSVLKIAK